MFVRFGLFLVAIVVVGARLVRKSLSKEKVDRAYHQKENSFQPSKEEDDPIED